MAEKTRYVVLRSPDGVDWSEYGQTEAGNSEQAIRQATKAKDGDHHEQGRYRAVPVRNWGTDADVVVIANETKTVSSFSKASPAPASRRRQAKQPEAEKELGGEKQLAGAAS